MRECMSRVCKAALVIIGLAAAPSLATAGTVVINFSDVPPGTLVVPSPYVSQGFTLSDNSGGFVFNSPDTGNGTPQPVGSNDFFAGKNGLAAFSPATITLVQTDGAPFSLLSIDLARNFAFDPAPTVTFVGTLVGGGTVTDTVTVTVPVGFPQTFQTFDSSNGLGGLTNLTSLSWDQPVFTQGLNQFTDITLSTVPEPSSLVLAAFGVIGITARFWARRRCAPIRNELA
jgi:PEP-CTERM motif